MTSKLQVRVPACSCNLGPGFDTLGLAVSLELRAQVEPDCPSGFAVQLKGEGQGILPDDARNWVIKSAREIAGDAVDRASWLIESEIPVARGLGSSAASRAAGVAIGQLLHDGKLSPRHEIFQRVVRTEVHPDSAAAVVYGGFRIGSRRTSGDGDSVPGVLYDEKGLRLLLVIPTIPVPTSQARSMLPSSYSRSASVQNLQALGTLLSGLTRGDWEAVRRGCRDQLHEPYRLTLVPGLAKALERLREDSRTGGAYLSGAGPILAAFLPDPEQGRDAADDALAILKDHGTDAGVRIVSLDDRGLYQEPV